MGLSGRRSLSPRESHSNEPFFLEPFFSKRLSRELSILKVNILPVKSIYSFYTTTKTVSASVVFSSSNVWLGF